MADNTTLDSGSGGDTIRTDDISGVKWPCDKIAFGADGSATLVDGSGNGLPILLKSSGGTEIGTNASPVQVGDAGGTLSIDDGSGSITVDGTVTANLAAGTNNIGDVDVLSIAAGDNNIGNVDVVTVPTDPFGANADAASATGSISAKLRSIAATGIPVTGTVAVTQSGTWDEIGINDSGNSITVDNAALSVTGGGVEASAVRVTIASDSTGVVSVDDNGGSITVDGTVAVSGTVTVGSHAVTNAGTFVVQVDGTGLTRLTDIETNTDSGAVVGNGAAATAQRVTLANDSTGIVALAASSAAIGKLAANSGVDIGDVDVTSISTGTNAIGRVGHDTTGLAHGVTTVTTAGTDVVLAASTACKWVIVQSQTDNTGLIAVGATGVDATEATGTGIILYAGDSIVITIDNLADVFIDSTVNGEGVRFAYGV